MRCSAPPGIQSSLRVARNKTYWSKRWIAGILSCLTDFILLKLLIKIHIYRNKNYKATTQNRTHIPDIFALVRCKNEKLQNYKLKLNMYTEYFCPGHKQFFSRNKNYKATTQNRTHIPDIFALVRC